MKRSTKQFITNLRKQFKETDDEGRMEIWDILTALRGPDVEDSFMEKVSTTTVIRQAIFGKKVSKFIEFASINPDEPISMAFRNDKTFKSNHFKSHAQLAFKALGLKWDEVNK